MPFILMTIVKKLIAVLMTTLISEKMLGEILIHILEWYAEKSKTGLDDKLVAKFKKEFEKSYG